MIEQDVIGLDKQAAIDLAHSQGYTVRISEENGTSNQLVGDYSPGRINIAIADGKVIRAVLG